MLINVWNAKSVMSDAVSIKTLDKVGAVGMMLVILIVAQMEELRQCAAIRIRLIKSRSLHE